MLGKYVEWFDSCFKFIIVSDWLDSFDYPMKEPVPPALVRNQLFLNISCWCLVNFQILWLLKPPLALVRCMMPKLGPFAETTGVSQIKLALAGNLQKQLSGSCFLGTAKSRHTQYPWIASRHWSKFSGLKVGICRLFSRLFLKPKSLWWHTGILINIWMTKVAITRFGWSSGTK